MSTSATVTTCLRSVRIEDVRRDLEGTLDEHFGDDEREAVANRAPPTAAGILALKLALADLADRLGLEEVPGTMDIEIGHEDDGRPVARRFPDPGGNLFVSISHDRENAWGVAALGKGTRY